MGAAAPPRRHRPLPGQRPGQRVVHQPEIAGPVAAQPVGGDGPGGPRGDAVRTQRGLQVLVVPERDDAGAAPGRDRAGPSSLQCRPDRGGPVDAAGYLPAGERELEQGQAVQPDHRPGPAPSRDGKRLAALRRAGLVEKALHPRRDVAGQQELSDQLVEGVHGHPAGRPRPGPVLSPAARSPRAAGPRRADGTRTARPGTASRRSAASVSAAISDASRPLYPATMSP